MSDPELVLVQLNERVATVTLNRPDKRNALSPALLTALQTTLEQLAANTDAGVIVLTGAGDRAFCAGADLSSAPQGGMLAQHEAREQFVDLLRTMAELGKPIIARVNGAVRGGGLGLVLACDLAVAADDVTFATPEIERGLFPMMIMALIFRNIGRKRAMELVLTGEPINAADAARIGVINRVVSRDDLDAAVQALAGRIAGFSPAALKLGRDAFYHSEDMDLWSALEFLRSQLTLNTMTEDAFEGVTAFFEKRAPRWKGR